MMSLKHLQTCVIATLTLMAGVAFAQDKAEYQTGMLPADHILLPEGDLTSSVFLISDGNGWDAKEQAQADAFLAKGAAVVGIDFSKYMESLKANQDECIYTISDIEELAQEIQRKAGVSNYRPPIVAGIGDGATLALAMIAQSPPATIGEAVVVDPVAGIPLEKVLCTPATKEVRGDRTIYGLTDGPLPAPVTVLFTPAADQQGREHVNRLVEAHPDINVSDATDDADTTLIQTLEEHIDASSGSDNPLGLPLTVLDAKPTLDTMAIIYSGDGGWRDLDKDVGDYLQKDGVPTIGVDSLRYFWSEKKPETIASDLSRIIETYRKQFKVNKVLLIGYSFGADILPITFNNLAEKDKARIIQMSLLSLSHEATFEISVGGWLGVSNGNANDPVNDLNRIDPKIVQCVYGTEDEDAACPVLKDKGAEIIGIEGGHHFDEDYEALAKRIVASLKQRLQK